MRPQNTTAAHISHRLTRLASSTRSFALARCIDGKAEMATLAPTSPLTWSCRDRRGPLLIARVLQHVGHQVLKACIADDAIVENRSSGHSAPAIRLPSNTALPWLCRVICSGATPHCETPATRHLMCSSARAKKTRTHRLPLVCPNIQLSATCWRAEILIASACRCASRSVGAQT
jgi:hypothetical protein